MCFAYTGLDLFVRSFVEPFETTAVLLVEAILESVGAT